MVHVDHAVKPGGSSGGGGGDRGGRGGFRGRGAPRGNHDLLVQLPFTTMLCLERKNKMFFLKKYYF